MKGLFMWGIPVRAKQSGKTEPVSVYSSIRTPASNNPDQWTALLNVNT